MRHCHGSFGILFVCAAVIGFCANVYAQNVKIMVKTLECDEGRVYHPTTNISIFDADKVPVIVQTVKDLESNLNLLNSDATADQKAATLLDHLHDLVANTPTLARMRKLPPAGHLFEIPSVRKVVIIAFYESEGVPFPYASRQLQVPSEHANNVIINFSSDEECKGAQ